MPAYRSSMASISSSSEAHLRRQYKLDVQRVSNSYNSGGRVFARGLGSNPYPDVRDLYNRSNTAVPDDNMFEDVGLNDFVLCQRRIARHQLRRRRDYMSVHQQGLIHWGQRGSYLAGTLRVF